MHLVLPFTPHLLGDLQWQSTHLSGEGPDRSHHSDPLMEGLEEARGPRRASSALSRGRRDTMGFRMARVVLASVLGDLALLCSQEGKHNPASQPHPTQTSSFRLKACVSSRPQFLLLMAFWLWSKEGGLGCPPEPSVWLYPSLECFSSADTGLLNICVSLCSAVYDKLWIFFFF